SCAGQALCDEGLTTCDGACVDLEADSDHCGACGAACAAGETCVAGACGPPCAAGETRCAGACADPQTDRDHCGACNVRCPLYTTCSAGACIATCPDDLTECGGQCVDPQTDPSHCGACDVACGAGESCVAGACGVPCPPGQTYCQGACTSTQSDPHNCGGCGVSCGPGTGCIGGSCQACDNTGFCGDLQSGCIGCALANNCAGELAACQNDPTGDCVAFWMCADACFYQDCIDQCAENHPQGAELFNYLVVCTFCVECYNDCDGADYGCL
ncbi:MAG: hypothetical protein IT372_18565, partial [Polyangiaceae bacterium]|nr:hypothetical protein [Polyangiaceae bacterium]